MFHLQYLFNYKHSRHYIAVLLLLLHNQRNREESPSTTYYINSRSNTATQNRYQLRYSMFAVRPIHETV